MRSFAIAVDVGGTFTDLAVLNKEDRALGIFKVNTTPEDYSHGIIEALKQAAESYDLSINDFLRSASTGHGGHFSYATTVGTNAIIEKKVGKVGLICTKGHRDVLTFREGWLKDPFYWDLDYPPPYVPRYLTIPVTERVSAEGQILRSLDEDEVRDAIRTLRRYKVDVIAVSLLWSIADPVHEKLIGEIIEGEAPEQEYVLSHLISPVMGEYRRTISTAISASLRPIVKKYLATFEGQLKELGYEGQLGVVSSSGGVLSVEDMIANPIYCVNSGPTGGPVAGLFFSQKELGQNDVVTCDMGGTSFDVSRVTDGQISTTLEEKIADDFLGIRTASVKTIGAGGGSIARLDPAGLLHVGPQSAGAVPGPACYGRGGADPTVTDANVLLGYLNPEYLLGGRMEVDGGAAHDSVADHIARPLKIPVVEAAHAIWSVVCTNMSVALKNITSWEGIDPAEYVILSGGGAAGCHIIPIMEDLGARRAIIPKTAGAFSAVGALVGDIVGEFSYNYPTNSQDFDFDGVNEILKKLERDAKEFLEKNGINPRAQVLGFSLEARYHSQQWDLTIPLMGAVFRSEEDVGALVKTFHSTHESRRGNRDEGQFIQCSTWRVRAIGKREGWDLRPEKLNQRSPNDEALVGMRDAYFAEVGGMTTVPIYDGSKLEGGNIVGAPAIIEERESTIVVFPDSEITMTQYGNYLVHLA